MRKIFQIRDAIFAKKVSNAEEKKECSKNKKTTILRVSFYSCIMKTLVALSAYITFLIG